MYVLVIFWPLFYETSNFLGVKKGGIISEAKKSNLLKLSWCWTDQDLGRSQVITNCSTETTWWATGQLCYILTAPHRPDHIILITGVCAEKIVLFDLISGTSYGHCWVISIYSDFLENVHRVHSTAKWKYGPHKVRKDGYFQVMLSHGTVLRHYSGVIKVMQ